MSAKKKAKAKRLPKPVLAWCALYEGKIKPGWCCAHRETMLARRIGVQGVPQ